MSDAGPASDSHPLLLNLFKDAGSPVLARDERKQTLAHAAARVGNIEALRLLGGRSTSLFNVSDRWGRTPLCWAVSG